MGGTDKGVEVLDAETGTRKWKRELEDTVLSVCVTGDGKLIVCGDEEGVLILLSMDGDVVTEKEQAHCGDIECLSLSNDDEFLATGSKDCKIKVWSMPELDLLACLVGHSRVVTGVQWLVDGSSRLVSGSRDGTITVWSMRDQSQEFSWDVGSDTWSVSISSSCELIAAAQSNHSVAIVDLVSFTHITSLRGHADDVTSLCFHPLNGVILLSGSEDETIRVWNVADQSCLRVLHSHTHTVASLSVFPDASFFISSSADRTIRKWKSESAMQSSPIDPFQSSLSWSVADCIGRQLMVKVVGKQVQLMNVDGIGGVRVIDVFASSVTMSADDLLVACSMAENTKIYSTSDLSFVSVIDIRHLAQSRFRTDRLPPVPLRCLCFSPDNQFLAGCYKATIYCFALSASGYSFSIAAPSRVCSLAIVSHFLVAGCQYGCIIIIDIHSQSIVNSFEDAHFDDVTGLESIDDDHFVSVSNDNSIRTWNIHTGRCCFAYEVLDLDRIVRHPSSGLIAAVHGVNRASICTVDAEYRISFTTEYAAGKVHLLSACNCRLDEQTSIDDDNLTILRRLGATMVSDDEDEDEKKEE